MSAGWDDAEARVAWRERRPDGWDGTGRMSLNEWWDDLVAPTRGILAARVLIVAVGIGLLVANGWPVLPVSLLLWGMAGAMRLRGQAPRGKPHVAPPPWRPAVEWTFEPGDHAVELLDDGAPDGRVSSECVRAVGHLIGSRRLRDIGAVYDRGAPCVVRRGLSQHSAEAAVRLLEASGAEARVVPPSAGTSRP